MQHKQGSHWQAWPAARAGGMVDPPVCVEGPDMKLTSSMNYFTKKLIHDKTPIVRWSQ
jgi:hypothetical protein